MKIGITGPTADRNLGDYAMFVNNVYDMGKSHTYTVFSYDGPFTNQLRKDYFSGYELNFTPVSFSNSEENKSKNIIWEKIKRIKRIKRRILRNVPHYPTDNELIAKCDNFDQIRKEVRELDVLVVSGGGYLNDLWFNWSRRDDLYKIFIPIFAAIREKTKIVFTANGFGPFDTSAPFYEIIFSDLKKSNAIISSRDDKYSPLYLNKLGVTEFVALPDDLYLVNENIMDNVDKNYNDNGYILIEMYGGLEYKKDNIAKIIKKYNEDGYFVKFVSFDVDESVLPTLGEFEGEGFEIVRFKDGYLQIEKIIELIKGARLVICNRYHALVLAVTNSVPVINIIKPVYDYRYYQNKNVGVLDRAFKGLSFDELDFISFDFDKFTNDLDLLSDIMEEQTMLYKTEEYKENKKNLAMIRSEFFKDNFGA
ncbi:polysaccharide pyruvyl transferase family protein [Vibrio breoganii]|uniref:polysaccharide pyruvyl transferase family protein n=1 Tax=Vibrio breoganii TaxID=553239 RepID=UPI0021C44797|nr:polysaccharide pyruvyl transferase family protein [Vibrio breoganii]MDN3715958.1 polysaccharide pyruvyl transferase family protein [Vibrio breoganii]